MRHPKLSINLRMAQKQPRKSVNSYATESRPQPVHSYGDWNRSASRCPPLVRAELIVEVEAKPFNAVHEQGAFEYGEGDCTVFFWLRDNWEFLSRWYMAIGHTPNETMTFVFSRFRFP